MRLLLAGAAAVVLGLAPGCGSSGDSDKTVPFVGNWTVTTGTLTAMCPDPLGTVMQKLDGGQQTITKSSDGSVTISILPNCNVILDVSGKVATLRATTPPQSCMLSFNGLPVMGTFTGGTFTVTDQTASFNYSGTAGLGLIMCPVSSVGMSMKVAAPEGGVAPSPDAGLNDGS
jgi:hypothetical protein